MEKDPAPRLSSADLAVLRVLSENPRRVLGRESIVRLAGLDRSNPRRCDAAIVVLRRLLGPDSILTVRRRGWMLTEEGSRRADGHLLGPAGGTRAR